MIIPLYLLAILAGPIMFFNGRMKNNNNLKIIGLVFWITGWAYMAWIGSSLLHVAG